MFERLKIRITHIIENSYLELLILYITLSFMLGIPGLISIIYPIGYFVRDLTGELLNPILPLLTRLLSFGSIMITGFILFATIIIAIVIIRLRKSKLIKGILLYDIFDNHNGNFKTTLGIVLPIIFMASFIIYIMSQFGYRSLGYFGILMILGGIIISLSFIAYTIQINKIMKNIENLGSLKETENTSAGLFLFTQIALDMLASTDKNIKEIVDEQLKSERLKTELITNISHDLKTPLTSIINYTDLLKKHDTDDEQVVEYVEVLDRNSHRLKVLITDLVYASKAETGNVDMELDTLELNELVSQVYGEFDYLFEKKEITFVFDPIEDIYVLADSNHLGRVLINIMDNAIKYSLEGTRIYAATQNEGDYTSLSLKNISKEKLNISPDELMERFIRGERSRHTEGSGLGLYISRSLIELMNGKLTLLIDGDLFEVKILIPSAEL